jgi:hypothetical protein
MLIPRFSWLAAAALSLACESPQHEAVALAERLEWTTTYAHDLLRAGFDHTVAREDESDHALLREVGSLDRAHSALSHKVEAFERERARGNASDSARQAVLDTLDVIGARYSAVIRMIGPRQTHQAVQHALAEAPALLARLRERVSRSH